MFERDVTISLNADVSNYSSSLSQAIAITQQYSSAADTALGTVAKMNAGFVQGLVKLSSGLTGPQKMATDTAAAYQQQLSGLQATAAVTGQNFGQLEKSTLSLARSFPIGMGQAVQQVQALQSAGVTSNKEIERLAVSFTKLGAANNSYGPELGQQMLQVTRAFGNSTTQVEALGDSLTTVSKTWGANASGVLTFSKAIAPIASTVGMSQTAVMGLSAAMSRLGEDGFMAANSFNKVLLDMNRGIRDGGPELKVYADLLNMTTDSLQKMAEQDPTEVLIRFTEGIAKAGPEVQRTLDALGLDGVRTTRSITALSRSGNLRDAVNTAVNAYGDGSTSKAAEEAFSGVNDQMTRLSESMRQTVGLAGKPFLGFMEDVLKVGNSVSDVTNKIMESKGVQTLATAGIVGGVGAGLLFKGLTATSIGAMAVNLLRAGSGSQAAQDFRSGREAARGGVAPAPGSSMATRMGGFVGTVQGPPAAPGATAASWRDRAALAARAAAGTASTLVRADANNMAQATGRGTPFPVSPAGAAARAALLDATRTPTGANVAAAAAAGRGYGATLIQRGGLASMAGTGLIYGREAAIAAGSGVRAGVAGAGRFLGQLGVTPALAGVAAVGVGGYLAYQQNQETVERRERIQSGATGDIFSAFNSFAEATGAAGRGLVNFTAAVNQATNNLSKNNTTYEQAGELTSEEAAQALSGGYTRAFNIVGDARMGRPSDVAAVTEQAVATLGYRPDPSMVSRVIQDIANETGSTTFARSVGSNLTDRFNSGEGVNVSAALDDIIANAQGVTPFGSSEESAQLALNLGRSMSQDSFRVSEVFGAEAGAIQQVVTGRNFYEEMRNKFGDQPTVDFSFQGGKRTEALAFSGDVLRGILGMNEENMDYIFGESISPGELDDMDFEAITAKARQQEAEGGPRAGFLDAVDEAERRGISLAKPDYESYAERTVVEDEAYRLQDSFEGINETSSTLSESLFGVIEAARKANVTLDELADRPELTTGLSNEQKLVLEAYNARTPGNVNAAGEAMAQQALREADGNIVLAQSRIRQEASVATEGTAYKDIMLAADKLLEVVTATQRAAMPETQFMLQAVRQGQSARQMGKQSNSFLESTRQEEIAAGAQAEAGFTDMARNFMLQKAQMDLQLRQARESAGLQMGQMARDYGINRARATEDFRTQELRANRDFTRQMNRQENDYQRDRRRANQDFRRQERFGEEDFNRQARNARQDYRRAMVRMEQDYTRQVSRTTQDAQIATGRAERDYQKSRARAIRDFDIQLNRMDQDNQTQRRRATDEFNLSMTRANEDYTKQRLRAQRDFNKQQEYAERDFMKSRTRSVEDFNKQQRRLVEDSAKSLYDPYKRIQAEMVMDGGQLVANLANQSKALADQLKVLDQLKASGLSQQSIDVLGLADTKNAQQAARLLADSMSDPTLLAQLNEQIAGRIDLTQMFATSSDNIQARRMAEDFATQLARMDEDYASSSARAAEQFNTAMADMATDYATQMARAAEDFNTAMARMGEDYATAVTRAREDQARGLADMAADHKQAMDDAAADLALVLLRMAEDYKTAADRAAEDFMRAMDRMTEEYNISVRRSRELFKIEMDRQEADFARMRRRAQKDFNTQMADASADFKKMLARMAQDYANAVSDMGASIALAEKHAMEALVQYGQNVAKGERGIFRDFAKFIAGLPADMQENMGESMRDMLQYMALTFPAMYRRYFPNGLAGIVLGNSGGLPSPAERGEGASPSPGPPSAVGSGPGGPVPVIPPVGFSPVTQENRTAWYKDMEAAGKDAWQGWADGFSWANPANWVKEVFNVVVEAVKTFLWIKSPSRVFEGLGKNTMEGFIKGITDSVPSPLKIQKLFTDMFTGAKRWLEDLPANTKEWIGNNTMLQEIAKSMPGANALEMLIEGRFDDFKEWLSDLPGNALKWIGNNSIFGKIAEALPGKKKLGDEIEDRFNTAKSFLGDLGKSIGRWIKTGEPSIIDGIMGAFPTPERVFNAIDKWFKEENGPKTWFKNIATLIGTFLPGSNAFASVFGKSIGQGFETFVNSLITKWNNFELKLGPIDVEIAGVKLGSFGPFVLDTPNLPPVNWFAQGGIVSGAQMIGVGEQGPEAVIPLNQRGAQVMADTLRQFIDDRAFDGALTNPYVINVEMADVNLDFTDSGSEFSQQARELLQRVKDAAGSTEAFMQATGLKITGIVDEVSDSLVQLAQAIEDAFGEAARDVEDDTKSIKDAVVSMNDAIEADFLALSDSLDTDLTDLTSSFSTAVDEIISETDRMIADAISSLEDFADWTGDLPSRPDDPDAPSTPGDPDAPGAPGDPGVPETPGGNTGMWGYYDFGYSLLNAADKGYVDKLVGGPLTEESFNNLSAEKQNVLAGHVYGAGTMAMLGGGGLTDSDKQALEAAFPATSGGGGPGGGQPAKPDLSFNNFDTLQKALGKEDREFLTSQFGGALPTAPQWRNKVSEQQRDTLIKALEDKKLSTSERKGIRELSLPSFSGPGEPGDDDKTGVEKRWDEFRAGYRQLSDSDKELVKAVFGNQAPTLELWQQMTVTQQQKLRDIVKDGSVVKDEKPTLDDMDAYKFLGPQIVDYAKKYLGVPYSLTANPPSTFDCSKFTTWVYRKFGKSITPYSDTQFSGGRNVTGQERPGDLVFFKTHPDKVTGHVGLYVGGGNMIDAPSPGRVVSINRATSRGDYKGARRYFAEGGIVNRRQEAVIGEAGPEVVVPLNERGAEFFAATMARYTQPQEAQRAMVTPYSTPVNVSINQTYDNRTMFTGPIEVAANNPDEFAAKAAAKQRRQRLSQPVGSSR